MEQTKEKGINHFFDETPVKNLVIKLGIPAMFAQFFNILYSIVDRIFVGRIPEVGDLSLASIGICAPALTAISAFAYMVGVGGASQMSVKLGQRDMEGAKKPVNNAFVMLIGISIVVTALALFFKEPLLYLLGCDDSMYPLASRYFTIYAAGTIFPLLGIGMNHFILAQGFSRAGMISVVIGALTNLILDPILIFGLDMGVEGAAVATVVAQAGMAVFTLWYLRRKKVPIRLEIGGYDFSVMKKIVLVGMMPFLITILDNGVVIILNASLRRYGGMDGTTYITCAAVIQSILTIVSCPAAGITQGCGTLYGYFYGAKETKKLDQTFTYVLWVCLVYIGGLQVLILLFPQAFAGLFLKDAAVMAVCVGCIRRFCLGLVGIAVQYAYVDGLTAMGKVRYALPLSLFRKTLYIILLLTMPVFLPVEHIFYAGSISDIIGASFALGRTGLDFVILDNEHGPFEAESSRDYTRAAELVGLTPIARVREVSRPAILKLLDVGVQGLIVPDVHTVEQVQEIVDYAKYFPVGKRGFCPSRKDGWGFDEMAQQSVPDQMAYWNEQVLVIPQCETVGAYENIETIVNMEGVDGIFIGPFDLSISMGIPGQFDHPEFVAALEKVQKVCKDAGKFCMIFAGNPAAVTERFQQGYDSVAYGLDAAVLAAAYKANVADIRSKI